MTRRGLLGAGALGALAAAGCGNRTPAPRAGGDAAVLGTVLAVQRSLADGWEHVDRPVAARARARVSALTAAGATPGAAVPGDVRRALARVRSPDDRDALLEAERAAGGALLSALPQLRGPDARALVTRVYAAGAQRASRLLADLGRDPLPDAFAGTLT